MFDRIQILVAAGVLLSALAITYQSALRVNNRLPVIDIGVWWLAFLAIYSIQPVLYWFLTGEYLSIATNRLEVLGASSADFAQVVGISAWYAAAFVPAYLLMRPSRARNFQPVARIGNDVLFPAVCLCVLAWLAIRLFFADIDAGYESRFVNISQESLEVRRVHKFASACLVISGFIVIIACLQRRELRIWALIALPVLLLLVSPAGTSRGTAAFVLLVFLISWHVLVRPISRGIWILLAIAGVLVFNLLGAMRSYGRSPGVSELIPWLIASGEFEHIFGNAVELLHATRHGLEVPQAARFAELFAFVPSEYLSFTKTSLAGWFMDTFHLELGAAGGGLAFGIMGQAIIGNGALEAILRGFIFGIVLGFISNYLLKNAPRYWWVFPAYLYLLVRIFDSVRSTMFGAISDLVQIFIPLIVFLCCAAALLRALPEKERRQEVA